MSFLVSLLRMLPDAAAQGLIWGILAMGVFITYKILDFSDLTVWIIIAAIMVQRRHCWHSW